MAGVVGFEPTIHGTKNRCLTTWLHPIGVGPSKASSEAAQVVFEKFLQGNSRLATISDTTS